MDDLTWGLGKKKFQNFLKGHSNPLILSSIELFTFVHYLTFLYCIHVNEIYNLLSMAALRKCLYSLKNLNINSVKYNRQIRILGNFIHRDFHSGIEYTKDKDPAPLYFHKDVQNLLKELTRVNIEKVFRHRKLETRRLETPTYKFMTDDELKQTFEEAAERANEMLQMPPVVKIRDEINEVLSQDPQLKGYETSNIVFTDITFGISDRDRLIVIRDTEGNLVKADWDTRQRMSQIYFPLPGRELYTPAMFTDEYLKNLLQRKEYEFILDRACVQFEPDDPEYQKITSIVYQEINENSDFEILRSTRHFGPLTFFLTWFKMIDNLLLELISTSNIKEANSLLNLFNKLHDAEKVGKNVTLKSDNDTNLIESYITEKSAKKGQLELALQSYKEITRQKSEVEDNIKKAHGLT